MSFSNSAFMQLYDRIDGYFLEKAIWLSQTPGGTYIRESVWEFPVIEGLHVVSIAMSVGMILWFDLRLMGVNMKRRPISEVFAGIYWWMVAGYTLAFITGLLLFWAEADRAYPNIFARIKFMGLLFAGLNILYFHSGSQKTQYEWDNLERPPLKVRMAGFLSITLWVVIISAGRLMAYTF